MGKTLEERLAWVEHKARLQEGFAEVVDIDLSKLVETTKSMQRTLEGHTKMLERQDQTLQSHGRMLHRLDQMATAQDERVTILDIKVTDLDQKVDGLDVRVRNPNGVSAFSISSSRRPASGHRR